jgi:hypothetical protein
VAHSSPSVGLEWGSGDAFAVVDLALALNLCNLLDLEALISS